MEGIQTFKGSWPWPWPWIRPYGILSCITHRPLPTYQISLKSKKLFVDRRTDVRTDIFPPSNIIRSTFGSRPNNITLQGVWADCSTSPTQAFMLQGPMPVTGHLAEGPACSRCHCHCNFVSFTELFQTTRCRHRTLLVPACIKDMYCRHYFPPLCC